MSVEESLKKILETFINKADGISTALTELRIAIQKLNEAQDKTIEKLDQIHLELRELSTRIVMALERR